MIRIYIDTCVYINWYRWEKGRNFGIHHGEQALSLFKRVEDGEFNLVISDHLDYQMSAYPEYKTFIDKIRKKGNLIEVKTTYGDKEQARDAINKCGTTEYDDALHAVLAMKGAVDALVTRNIEHFGCFDEDISISLPEHIDWRI
ncbi:MAG: hypothetical protein V1914_01710 [archaeon]